MSTAAPKIEPIDAPFVKGLGPNLVPIEDVKPSPTNPRKHLGDLAELTSSIKRHGILQNLLARPNGKGFELVSGHRRLAAAKAAGLKEVPVNVREISDREVIEIQLVENCQRSDIHPLEEADAYEQLHTKHKIGIDELAAKVGKSKAYVYGRMKLCDLVNELARESFVRGVLSPSIATIVARLAPADQEKAALVILSGDEYQSPESAVEFKKEYGDDWAELRPMSFREAADYVHETFELRLKEAPFDTTDEALLPVAGSCTKCPKRSGSQPELFPDIKSADVCTDSICFKQKKQASFVQLQAKAKEKEKGQKVLADKKAESLFSGYDGSLRYNSSHVLASGKCEEDPKKRTWRELLGTEAPPLILARKPGGAVAQMFDKAAAIEVLAAKGVKFAKETPTFTKETPEAKEKREAKEKEAAIVDDLFQDRAIATIGREIRAKRWIGDGLAFLLERATFGYRFGEESKVAVARCGIQGKPTRAQFEKLSQPDAIALLVELALIEDAYDLGRNLAAFGLDTKKIRDAIKAERATAAAKPATSKPAAKKPLKGKPKK